MGLNIVVHRRIFPEAAVGLEGSTGFRGREAWIQRGKRLFFFVPWGGHTLIGTRYRLCGESPDVFRVEKEDICRMLEEISQVYPRCGLSYGDVTFCHGGLLPCASFDRSRDAEALLEKKSSVILHERGTESGLLSLRGVKYTTAPEVAREALARIRSCLKAPRTGQGRKHWGSQRPSGSVPADVSGLSDMSNGAVDSYIEEEMALTLGDIVWRRTNAGAAQRPPYAILRSAAERMALRLGWTEERKASEIRRVLDRYELFETPKAE
jgi:glycerol-3-phosphate dehydrogenase